MKLTKDGVVVEVRSELQASPFIRNGFTVLTEPTKAQKQAAMNAPVEAPAAETPAEDAPAAEEAVKVEKPKRRRRSKKTETYVEDDKRFSGLLED